MPQVYPTCGTQRQLTGATVGGKTYSYGYNSSGIRTRKTNYDGGYTEYYVVNGLPVAEQRFRANGTKQYILRYLFDEGNSPVGFGIYYPTASSPYWQYYYFSKNPQGDVIALYRSDYNSTSKTYTPTLVATYTYDPWGTPIGIFDANGSTISQTAYHVAAYNPFRYRGYRYDGDTRLYYLQSRYYDPVVKRFINADRYASTGQGLTGHNTFAYCLNNPIVRIDPSGNLSILSILAIAAAIAALSGCSSKSDKAGSSAPAPSDFRLYSSGTGPGKHNCYSYAFDLAFVADPGDFAYKCAGNEFKTTGAMYASSNYYTVNQVAEYVMADATELKLNVRIIDNPSEINSSEYCVALKVTTDPGREYTEYHFMYQLSNGEWAEKFGSALSTYGENSGMDDSWTYGSVVYDSKTVFFAVPIH